MSTVFVTLALTCLRSVLLVATFLTGGNQRQSNSRTQNSALYREMHGITPAGPGSNAATLVSYRPFREERLPLIPHELLPDSDIFENYISPYDRVREVNPAARKGLREIIDFAIADGRPAFIFVNNRLEGNSPMTIVAITD